MREVYACYIVYNSEKILPLSLYSIISYVEKVIIVDGAFVNYPYTEPQSTDKTKQIAENICGEKLIWIDCPNVNGKYVPWKNEIEKRNAYLLKVPNDVWMYIIDDDVVLSGNLDVAFTELKTKDWNCKNLFVEMKNFYPVIKLSQVNAQTPPHLLEWFWATVVRSGPDNIEDLETKWNSVGWIDIQNVCACLYLKCDNMHYLGHHSALYIGNTPMDIKRGADNILNNIISVNMKFLCSLKKFCDDVKYKRARGKLGE
jgi:hypothetical protein